MFNKNSPKKNKIVNTKYILVICENKVFKLKVIDN